MKRKSTAKGDSVCYLLRSRRSNGAPVDNAWYESEFQKAQCSQCCRVWPHWFPNPLDQVLAEKPTGVGSDCLAGGFLWKRKLVDVLRPWLIDCVFGRVFVRTNKKLRELDEWTTCYVRPGLEIFESRGKLAFHRPCDTCGYPLPMNGATAQRIVRRDIKPDRIALTRSGVMYLHSDIEAAVDWTPFKDAYRGSIKLIDEPEDGQCLPGDPDWVQGNTRFADPPPKGQKQWIDDPDQTEEPQELL